MHLYIFIAARKLIIYSEADRTNPLSAAEITNNSGRTLDGGPITVYDAGAYAGEAIVETVKNGDKRFISYGVDLGARISTNLDTRSDDVREVHVRDGILTTRSAFVQKKTYTIRNVDPRPKTLIIEHPVRGNYTLIDTPKPVETAQNVYRFEVKVPANGSVDFPVTEENVYDRQTAVSSIAPDVLLAYIRNGKISDAARRPEIAVFKTKIVANTAEKNRIDAEVQSVTRDEERNRRILRVFRTSAASSSWFRTMRASWPTRKPGSRSLRDRQSQLETEHAALQQQQQTAISRLQF